MKQKIPNSLKSNTKSINHTSIHFVLVITASIIEEKEISYITIIKEETELSLLFYSMVFLHRKPKIITQNLLELIREFSKVSI